MHDQLGQEAVIGGRHPVAVFKAPVPAHPFARRVVTDATDDPRLRHKAGGRVFGNDAGLDGVPAQGDGVLRQGQGLAGGHAQLPLYQVQPRHHFGHRMLDLEAGVHLEEIHPVGAKRARAIGHEFDRARIAITHRARQPDRSLGQRRARFGVHAGGGRLFHQLLAAALERAVAFEQVDDIAVRVAEHLDLEMARTRDQFLEQDAVVAKGGRGLAPGGLDGVGQFGGAIDSADAAPAAPRDRLHQQRKADPRRGFGQPCGGHVVALDARHHGHAGGARDALGLVLQAHGADGGRGRADPN